MDKSCPVVVLRNEKDECKHRAVSMDKSCPVVVLGNGTKISGALSFLLFVCRCVNVLYTMFSAYEFATAVLRRISY